MMSAIGLYKRGTECWVFFTCKVVYAVWDEVCGRINYSA